VEVRQDGKAYRQGILFTGIYTVHNKLGVLREEQAYSQGLKHGPYLLYGDQKNVRRRMDYADGQLLREREWYPNGQIKSDKAYEDGVPAGISRIWHENGRLQRLLHWEADRGLHGVYLEFDAEGNLLADYLTSHGKDIAVYKAKAKTAAAE
jgi:antitoxin component YwqK of YwqJK toxin-antitoxin module